MFEESFAKDTKYFVKRHVFDIHVEKLFFDISE